MCYLLVDHQPILTGSLRFEVDHENCIENRVEAPVPDQGPIGNLYDAIILIMPRLNSIMLGLDFNQAITK